ncbi:MAG: hypothetical protein AVDCRST_MAG04-3525, partial [uncultured Acetobacteraceae bacterium]
GHRLYPRLARLPRRLLRRLDDGRGFPPRRVVRTLGQAAVATAQLGVPAGLGRALPLHRRFGLARVARGGLRGRCGPARHLRRATRFQRGVVGDLLRAAPDRPRLRRDRRVVAVHRGDHRRLLPGPRRRGLAPLALPVLGELRGHAEPGGVAIEPRARGRARRQRGAVAL